MAKKDDFNKQLEALDKAKAKSLAREANAMEHQFQTMLDRQQDLLLAFVKSAGEDIQDDIKDSMTSQQELLEQQLEDMKNSYAMYGKYMTSVEKKTFKNMYEASKDGMEGISKEMRKRFGEIEDDIDDLGDSMSSSFGDMFDGMKDALDTINISSIASSLQENVDAYVKNMRQIRSRTSNFNEKEFADIVSDSIEKNQNANRNEVSEYLQSFITEMGMRNTQEIKNYAAEAQALNDTFGVSLDSISNIIWKDNANAQNGKFLRTMSNMAISLEDNENLYTHADTILAAINENVDAFYGLAQGDSKKQLKMAKNVATLTALQESAANAGVDNMTEAFTKWSKLTVTEAVADQDEQLVAFANFSGQSIPEVIKTLQSEGGVKKEADLWYNMLQGKSEQELYTMRDALGYESVADMYSMTNMSQDELDKMIDSADLSMQNIDDNTSMAAEATQEISSWLEKKKNLFSDNFIVKGLSDLMGNLGIDFTDIVATGVALKGTVGAVKKVGGWIGKATGTSGAGQRLLTVGKEKVGGAFKGLFKSGKGAQAGSEFIDDVSKTAINSIDDTTKAGTEAVEAFAKTTTATLDDDVRLGSKALETGTKLASEVGDDGIKAGGKLMGKLAANYGDDIAKLGGLASKAAGPLAVAGVALDGVLGATETKNWFGEDAGVQQTAASAIGGALGGTGPGIMDEGSVGEKALNIGGNALKWAAVGSVIAPGVGTAIGAVAGAVVGAIGGERIAKAADKVLDFTKEAANVAFETTGVAVNEFAGVVSELGPVGEGIGNTLTESWSAVEDAKSNIEAVWADPNSSFLQKIGGSVSEVFKAEGSIAKSIIKNVKETASKMWNSVKEKAKKVWDGIKSVASKAWDGIKSFASAAWDGVKETASTIWNGLNDRADEVWNNLVDGTSKLAEAGASLLEAGGSLLEGAGAFASGIGEGFGAAAQGTLTGGAEVLRAINGDKSVGEAAVDTVKELYGFGKEVFSDIGNGIKGGVEWVGNGIKNGLEWGANLLGFGSSDESSGGGTLLQDAFHSGLNALKEKAGLTSQEKTPEQLSLENIDLSVSEIKDILGDSSGENKRANTSLVNALNKASRKSYSGSGVLGSLFSDTPNLKNANKDNTNTNTTKRSIWQRLGGFLGIGGRAVGGRVSDFEVSMLAESGPEWVIPETRSNRGILELLYNNLNSYDTGTAWVPDDQVALVHKGEMIVPADSNPFNGGTSSNADNDDVVETLKWMVYRLESKLDQVIATNNKRIPKKIDNSATNEAYSFV